MKTQEANSSTERSCSVAAISEYGTLKESHNIKGLFENIILKTKLRKSKTTELPCADDEERCEPEGDEDLDAGAPEAGHLVLGLHHQRPEHKHCGNTVWRPALVGTTHILKRTLARTTHILKRTLARTTHIV